MDSMPLLVLLICSIINIYPVLSVHFQKSAKLPGDIIVGGLFTVYFDENEQCRGISETSVQVFEAVKWIFNQLNDNNYIPGVKIGLLALPTCRLSSEANIRVFDLISQIRNIQTSHVSSEPIVGIIGPEFSSVAQTTSQIFSSLPLSNRLLQIGISTTASILDDKIVYKNFYKVIPSDDIQVKVMVALMKKLKWNRIAVIYENDTYGEDGEKQLRQEATSQDICVAESYKISVNLNRVSSHAVQAIISDIKQKNINGVVFFGNSATAHALLIASEKSIFSEPVQFIFSEAVDLKDDIFKNVDTIINNAKGSYIVSPPKLQMDEFAIHWKSLFSNMTRFSTAAKTNPWLVDLFESYTNCRPNTSSDSTGCNPLSLHQIEVKYTESLSISYAIRSALVMAKVLSEIYVNKCGSDQSGICTSFKEIMINRTGTIISQMKYLQVDFQSDFPFNISQFKQNSLILKFENGEMTYFPETFPQYEVYQYRNCLRDQSQFCLVQVGNYTDTELRIKESLIKDYSTDFTVGKPWSDNEGAVCKPGTKCTSCISGNLPQEVFYQDGDVLVVGIIPVYHQDPSHPMGCGSIRTSFGMQLAEALVYTVTMFNENYEQFSHYFQNKKIGFLILNSCNQALIVQNKIMNIYENGVVLRNGSRINVADKIIGFIGAYGSGISIAMANVLTKLKYVQISYASTAAVLSDRTAYPYFLRVATPDDEQSKILIRLVKELDSNYIQIIYSSETYGIGGRNYLRQHANLSKVCIANEIKILEGKYNAVLDTLRQKPFAKIVILFIRSHMVPEFMKIVSENMNHGEFMFIATEGWGRNLDIIRGNKKLKGSLSLSMEMAEYEGFTSYLQTLDPQTYSENPWFQTYFENKYQCYFTSSYDKTLPKQGQCANNLRLAKSEDFQQLLWSPFLMNAVSVLIMGASRAMNDICGSQSSTICPDLKRQPEKLLESIKAQMLNISGRGNEAVFDKNGDGSVGYQIYNTQDDPSDRQKLLYKKVGSSPLNGKFEFRKLDIVYPDNFNLPSVCPNDVICRQCFPDKTTTEASQINSNSAVTGLGVFVGLLLVIIIVLIVAIVIIIRRCKQELVRNAEIEYLHAIPDETDHYSHVDDESIRHRPSLPKRKLEAQAAVIRPKSTESAAIRDSDKYLSPAATNNGFSDGNRTEQEDNDSNKLAKPQTDNTENHELKTVPKINAASF